MEFYTNESATFLNLTISHYYYNLLLSSILPTNKEKFLFIFYSIVVLLHVTDQMTALKVSVQKVKGIWIICLQNSVGN